MSRNKVKINFSSNKFFLLLTCLFAVVVDTYMVYTLVIRNLYNNYLYAFLGLDLIFIITVLISNYRFKYTRIHVLLFSIIEVLLVGSLIYFAMFYSEKIIFTKGSVLWFSVTHLMMMVSVIFSSLFAAKVRKIAFITILAFLFCGAFSGAYIDFVHRLGIFGQHNDINYGTLVYEYDEDSNGYMAVDILEKDANAVYVPAVFNDKLVTSFDATLFETYDLVEFKIDDYRLRFTNLNDNIQINKELKFLFEGNILDINDFRKYLYDLDSDNSFFLANRIEPILYDEGNNYITIKYTKEEYDTLDGEIIPILEAKKGTPIDEVYNSIERDFDYVLNRFDDTQYSLEYAFNNEKLDGKIFVGLKDEDGNLIENFDKSINGATMELLEVKKINFLDSNDTVYKLPNDFDDVYYTTIDKANELIENYPTREGFSLSFSYAADNSKTYVSFTDLTEVINNTNAKTYNIKPTWKLNAPTNLNINVPNKTLYYGDSVNIRANATSPNSNFNLSYSYSGNVTSNSNILNINKVKPENSGEYTLIVTAYNGNISSLSSTLTYKFNLNINKKPLHFNLENNLNLTYNAYDQYISISPNEEDIIDGDVIDFTAKVIKGSTNQLFTNSDIKIKNAGEYEVEVSLNELSEYYFVINDLDNIIIDKAEINLTWEDKEYIYDGLKQSPTASINGNLASDVINLNYITNDSSINAGKHSVTASLDNNSAINYLITNPNKDYEIEKREISINYDTTSSFIYNSELQKPNISSINNIVEKDNEDILNEIYFNYNNQPINVGNYTINANLNNNNYSLVGDNSKEFTITPYIINDATFADETFIYNGEEQYPKIITFAAGYPDEESTLLNDLIYDYDDAINVGSKIVKARFSDDSNYKFNNEEVSKSYEIGKREITLALYQDEIYNSNPMKPEISGIANVVSKDYDLVYNNLNDQIISTYTNVGNYKYEFNLNELTNYCFNFGSNTIQLDFNILQKTLYIDLLDITKDYDKKLYQFSDKDYEVTGLCENDNINEVLTNIQFSGDGTTNYNYGNYTYNIEYETNPLKGNNYNIVEIEDASLNINKAKLEIIFNNISKTYDGKPYSFDESLYELNNYYEDTTPLSYLVEEIFYTAKDVGRYSIGLRYDSDLLNNYDYSPVYPKLTINKKTIDLNLGQLSKIYDGQEFVFDLDFSNVGFVEDIEGHYEFEYEHNPNVGTYNYIFLISNDIAKNYEILNNSSTFEIKPLDLTLSLENNNLVYNGQIQEVKLVSSTPLFDPNNATISYDKEVKNVDNYNIFITINDNNFNLLTKSLTFNVIKATVNIVIDDYDYTYNGLEFDDYENIEIDLSEIYEELTYGIDYELNVDDMAVDVNSYKLNLNIINQNILNNYDININDAYLNIKPKEIEITIENDELIYNNEVQIPNYIIAEELYLTYELYQNNIKIDEAKEIGEYQIKFILNDKNYKLINDTFTFKIIDMEVVK